MFVYFSSGDGAMHGYAQGLDRNMMRVLEVLRENGGWMTVKDVTSATGLHRDTVARKLEALTLAGLVETSWEGRARVFRVVEGRVREPQASLKVKEEGGEDEWNAF